MLLDPRQAPELAEDRRFKVPEKDRFSEGGPLMRDTDSDLLSPVATANSPFPLLGAPLSLP